jgi:outer membrane receptor protein involved in Fe transport
MDARIEKEFTFKDVGMTIGIDAFNLFNKSVVLQRALALQRATGNDVQEVTSPRIFRIGARFSFR